MNRLADGPTLEYSNDARYASQVLLNAADNPVLVLRNGELVGLLRGSDILQWMLLHQAGGRRNMLIGSFTGVGSSDD